VKTIEPNPRMPVETYTTIGEHDRRAERVARMPFGSREAAALAPAARRIPGEDVDGAASGVCLGVPDQQRVDVDSDRGSEAVPSLLASARVSFFATRQVPCASGRKTYTTPGPYELPG